MDIVLVEEKSWGRHTGSEVKGVKDQAQRFGVAIAGGVAKGDGDIVDGLDVAGADDLDCEGRAGGDDLRDSDAGDAGTGDGQEGGNGGDVEEHLEDCWFGCWEKSKKSCGRVEECLLVLML